MKQKPSSIGFVHELVEPILDGSKTLTYRIGDKYNFLQVGDLIDARDGSNDRIFATLQILEIQQTTFKNLPLVRKGHSAYKSKEEQKEAFSKYYNNIQDSDTVIIIGFKVIKKH